MLMMAAMIQNGSYGFNGIDGSYLPNGSYRSNGFEGSYGSYGPSESQTQKSRAPAPQTTRTRVPESQGPIICYFPASESHRTPESPKAQVSESQGP